MQQAYMPVLVPTAEQPEQQPASETDQEQNVSQPVAAPVNNKKLEKVQANLEKYKRRVKCTSTVFMLIGCIGMCASVYYQFTAKHHAMMMVNFPPPPPPEHGFGGRHGHGQHGPQGLGEGHHPPPHHWFGGKHGHGHHPPPPPPPEELEEMAPKYVSREEFALYDAIKTMATITFFLFAKMVAFGKCGRKMAHKNKSKATKKMLKMQCLGFILIVIVAMIAMHEKHEIKHIMKKVRKDHVNKGLVPPRPDEEGPMPPMPPRHHDGRHLDSITFQDKEEYKNEIMKQVPDMLKTDERTCFSFNSTESCAMDNRCVWCSIKTMPGYDVCHSVTYAQTLPIRVFKCEWPNVIEDEEKDEINPEIDNITEHGDKPMPIETPVNETEAKEEQHDGRTQIIWGLPWKSYHAETIMKYVKKANDDAASGHQEHHGRGFGGHGRGHGKHGGRHHRHGCKAKCIVIKMFFIALFGTHFLFVRGLKHYQEMQEILTGKKDGKGKGCKKQWKKQMKKVAQAIATNIPQDEQGKIREAMQTVQQTFAPKQQIDYSQVYDDQQEILEEKDKEEGSVFVPQNSSTQVQVNQNQMI